VLVTNFFPPADNRGTFLKRNKTPGYFILTNFSENLRYLAGKLFYSR
jgi:hypothetical protein